MLKIIAIMAVGVLLGYLVRRSPVVKWVGTTSMATIVLLLFLMGVEIGGNSQIVAMLPTLGVEALMIAVAATLGSVMAARVVYNRFLKRGGDE